MHIIKAKFQRLRLNDEMPIVSKVDRYILTYVIGRIRKVENRVWRRVLDYLIVENRVI